MSLAAEPLLPLAPEPEFADPARERRLRPVEAPARRRRPRLAYAILALAGAVLIGATQMVLSIAATQDSFVVADLTQHKKELTWQAQALEEDLAGLSSPQSLATAASGLGLVVGGPVNYLRLSDGAVVGAASEPIWRTTVDPNGAGAVPNALVAQRAATAAAAAAEEETAAAVPEQTGPPAAVGLPVPTTR